MRFYVLILLPIMICHSQDLILTLNEQYIKGKIKFYSLVAGKFATIDINLIFQIIPNSMVSQQTVQISNSNFNDCVVIPYQSVDKTIISHQQQDAILVTLTAYSTSTQIRYTVKNVLLPPLGGSYIFIFSTKVNNNPIFYLTQIDVIQKILPITYLTYGKTFEMNSLIIQANLYVYYSDINTNKIYKSRFRVPELLIQQVECKREQYFNTYCHIDQNNNNDIIIEDYLIHVPYGVEKYNNVIVKITNINNPPTIEPYNTYSLEVLDWTDQILAIGNGILQVLEASEFDSFTLSSTNSRGSLQTTLTISLLSQYYTLPDSTLQIQFSEMPQIEQINLLYSLKQYSYSIVDNKILIQIPQRMEVPLFNIEIILINLNYQTTLQLTASIYHNNYLSLQSTKLYSILPSPYKLFSISRFSEVVSQFTTLSIQIQLNQQLQSGQITIDFPSELGQAQKVESMLNGDTFSFTYQIQNFNNVCQTSPFKSQSFTNGKLYEELVDIVTLTQICSTLPIKSVIFTNPTIASTTDIVINLNLEQIDLLILLDPIFPVQIIKCEFEGLCIQTDYNTFKISGAPISQGIVLKNVKTPNQLDPISITFSTFEGNCFKQQATHQQSLQPSTLYITSQLSTLQLGMSVVWQFQFQILYELNNYHIIQFFIPKELSQSQEILCEFRSPISIGASCNKGIIDWTPQIASGSMIQLIVSGLFNPFQKINLAWTIKIFNQNQQLLSQGITSFNSWTDSHLQYAQITLLDQKLNKTKEAILNINLQFPITKIYFKSSTPIYCQQCELKQGYTLIIYQTQDASIQLPFRYIYETAQMNYTLETYLNDQILESGVYQQVMQLYCHSKCLTCEDSFSKCTSCIDGFYFGDDCVETCPEQYYGYQFKCLPCYISFCAKCAISEDAAEHCIECTSGKQLSSNNTCVSNISTTNITTPVKDPPPITHPQQYKFEYQITYQFPGTLIILTVMILLSLITKFKNRYSVTETIFYVQLCLLEYTLGIVLLIYFLASHRFNIAFLSISLTIGQLIQQSQTIIHLNSQLSVDSDYQQYKKNWSVRVIHYITLCFTFQCQLMLTSKITKHKQWNYGWTMKESILRLLRQQMKSAPIYSIYQTSIVIASLLESQIIETFYLEIIGVNLISIILNFKHQYKFYKLDQSIEF